MPATSHIARSVERSIALERTRAVLSDWRGRNGIVVFGAGAHTHKILHELEVHADKIIGITDDSPQLWGRRIGQWPVCSPEDLLDTPAGGLLVSSDTQQSTLEGRLRTRFGDRFAILTLYPPNERDRAPLLAETGERQTGRCLEEIEIGHRVRYFWALQHLRNGANVLDAACGNGYGSFILAEGGSRVFGVDISEDAIRFARHYYDNKTIAFHHGAIDDDSTLCKLAKDAVPFDAVVSFETIEHLKHPEMFLDTAQELLRPGGAIFCSTPNACVMSLEDAHFHRHHFEVDEMLEMLSASGFTSVNWFGHEGMQILNARSTPRQRYVLYQGMKR